MIRRTLLFLALLAFSVVTHASVPPLLNYQGVLHDAAGDPVPNGNYSVTFRIWDSETAGADLWQEGRLVTVQDGLFTVLLGSIAPISDTLFSSSDRWIGVQVGLDPEMSPRQKLVSVPFAWHAMTSDHAGLAESAAHADTASLALNSLQANESNHADSADHSVLADTALFAIGSAGFHHIATDITEAGTTSMSGWAILATINVGPNEASSMFMILSKVYGTGVWDGSCRAYGVLRITVDGVQKIDLVPAQQMAGTPGSACSAVSMITHLYAPTATQIQNGFAIRIEGISSNSCGSTTALAQHYRTDVWGM